MSQNTHGKLFATISFGYSTKLLLPLDDATKVITLFKDAAMLTGYGDTLAIETFSFENTITMEIVNELAINKLKIKKTIGV